MRKQIKEFVAIAAETLPLHEPIYEFGSLQTPGQRGFADLRPLFPGRQFVGADMREGPGVDRILNLQSIELPSDSVGMAICVETLEHVEHPQRAVEEIHRILVPGGLAVITSGMYEPIHNFPHDYWRFTPEAFRTLLYPFGDCFVGFAGHPAFPDTVVGIGFKGDAPDLSRFEERYRRWQKAQRWRMDHLVIQVTPLCLIPLLFRMHSEGRKVLESLGRRLGGHR